MNAAFPSNEPEKQALKRKHWISRINLTDGNTLQQKQFCSYLFERVLGSPSSREHQHAINTDRMVELFVSGPSFLFFPGGRIP